MAYQSKYTGAEIDASIDINNTQNDRLIVLENSTNNLQIDTNNLQIDINNLQNDLSVTSTELNKVKTEVIPITRGGTGATSVNQAMSNLGGSYATARWNIPDNTTGTISTTLTITTHGRPVFVGIQYTMQGIGGDGYWGTASIFRDDIHLQSGTIVSSKASFNSSGSILYLDIIPAGTYTYTFQYGVGSGTIQLNEANTPSGKNPETPIIFAFEI